MDLFTIITILIVLAALFGYINVRYFKLPDTIGLMITAIIFTTAIIISGYFSQTLYSFEHSLVEQIDFHDVLMDVMLSFLLFAGALHTNFDQLKVQRYPILSVCNLRSSCLYFFGRHNGLLFNDFVE